jgi:hypothetical protein
MRERSVTAKGTRKEFVMNSKLIMYAAFALVLPTTFAMAQTTQTERHSIQERQARQQARINHGVADGQITPGGAARADRNQAKIANQETQMRNNDGGNLTAADRHRLANEQNSTSRGIYNRNHNATTDPGVAPQPVSPSRPR